MADGDWMSPLRRAERFLATRLVALERELPADGADDPRWDEYYRVADTLTKVRAQLVRGPFGPAALEARVRGRRER